MPIRRTEGSFNLQQLDQSRSLPTDLPPQSLSNQRSLDQRPLKDCASDAPPLAQRRGQTSSFNFALRQASALSEEQSTSTPPVEKNSFPPKASQGSSLISVSAKTALVDYLHILKDKLRDNRDPDVSEMKFMPLLAKTENLLDPKLNLRFMYPVHNGEIDHKTVLLREVLTAVKRGNPVQWQGIVNDGLHGVAVSVKHSKEEQNKVSIVVIDSVKEVHLDSSAHISDATYMTALLNAMNGQSGDSPLKIHVAYLYSEMQLGRRGCNLFALIAAKEMANSSAVAGLHATGINHLNSTNAVFQNAHLEEFQKDAFKLLEPRFFKHSTSFKTIEQLFRFRPSLENAIVNQKDQTLVARYGKYEVARAFKSDDPRRFSTSLEIKRIKLLERVLHTLGDELETKPLAYFAAEQASGPHELLAVMRQPDADQIDFSALMRAGLEKGWEMEQIDSRQKSLLQVLEDAEEEMLPAALQQANVLRQIISDKIRSD